MAERQQMIHPGYIRGVRRAARMLADLPNEDECAICETYNCRDGQPQDRTVFRVVSDLMQHGTVDELSGFCAALTEVCSVSTAYARYFEKYATRLERVRRWRARRAISA